MFSCLDMGTGLIFHTESLDYFISQNIQAKPCGFIWDNNEARTTKQMWRVSLTYIVPNSCDNFFLRLVSLSGFFQFFVLGLASFPGFFQNVAF